MENIPLCFKKCFFQKEIDDDLFSSVVRVDDACDVVGYANGNGNGNSGSGLTMTCEKLPEPTEFGDGNPFLMFLCLVIFCLLFFNVSVFHFLQIH